MSNIKYSPNLFLESQELKRLDLFFREKGYEFFLKQDTIKWGILNNVSDSSFNGFKITDAGSFSDDTINVSSGVAIGYSSSEEKIKLAINSTQKQIIIPTVGDYYWVICRPVQTSFEVGVCTVNINGTLTGVDTKFTEVLRGQPNFPSVISFQKNDGTSLVNDREYTVLEIDDDNNISLQGSFAAETNLIYRVVGTFTPGVIPQVEDKYIFQYDSVSIELQEVVGTTPPTLEQNVDFLLAKVRRTGSIIEINDYRSDSLYKNRSEFKSEKIELQDNVLLGIEKISYDDVSSTLDKNIVEISHGLRSDNFSFDPNQNKITINGGLGGKYKDSSYFNNGDFNSWRLYLFNSSDRFYKINTSTKSGSSIILSLDTLNVDDFSYPIYSGSTTYNKNDIVQTTSSGFFINLISNNINDNPDSVSAWSSLASYSIGDLIRKGDKIYKAIDSPNVSQDPESTTGFWTAIWKQFIQQVLVVPDCDAIEYIFTPASSGGNPIDLEKVSSGSISNLTKRETFKINTDICRVPVLAFEDPVCFYNFRYRYVTNSNYSEWKLPKTDTIGYLDEDGVRHSYSNDISFHYGYVKVRMATNSYSNVVSTIYIGDKKGIEIRGFQNFIDLAVNRDKEWQLIQSETDGVDNRFSTSSDIFINLKTFTDSPNFNTKKAEDGNKFTIQINQGVVLNPGVSIKIKQDSSNVSPDTIGEELLVLTQAEISCFRKNNGFLIIANYDAETDKWKIWTQNTSDQLGVVEEYFGLDDAEGKIVANGRTISPVLSTPISENVENDDFVFLYMHLWNNSTNTVCPVTGGRTSALADWVAKKPLKLPDLRSKFIVGFDDEKTETPQDLTYPTDKLVKNYGALGNEGGLDSQILKAAESGVGNHGHTVATLRSNQVGSAPSGGYTIFPLYGPATPYIDETPDLVLSAAATSADAAEASENRPKFIVLNRRILY